MRKIIYPDRQSWQALCRRPADPAIDSSTMAKTVFDAVERTGDAAVLEYIRQYEGRVATTLAVDPHVIEQCAEQLSVELKNAIGLAADNIRRFHQSQRESVRRVEPMSGVTCWRESRPVERVGIYIPGGSAPLFSTVLMLAIPAQLAGCREIVLCTPADASGNIHPAILYAARLTGVSQVFAVGGMQAIAAMAMGTATIPKADKIFGPGNQYVTAAKNHAFSRGVAIDLPAGPSEVLIIADSTAVPAFVAADLLSQAEHGPDSQVTLLSDDEALIDATLIELGLQLDRLPRKDIAARALGCSQAILLPAVTDCFSFSNLYAPEHLIIAMDDAENYVPDVSSAGSVFLGHYSCESAGDYASGTNHTLPTNGAARSYSGVSLDSFVKKISFQHISREGLAAIGPAIELMAEAENLRAHREAVTIRLTADTPQTNHMTTSSRQRIYPRTLGQLVRPNILQLSPYSGNRSGTEETKTIYLDANESPSGPADVYNRYPDAAQVKLKARIAALQSVAEERIFLGNGSDEIIDLCFRIFCRPGVDKAITFGPTFSMYNVIAQLNDVELVELPLDGNFQPRQELLSQFQSDENVRLLLLCSPNNPTGNSFDELEALVQNFRGITLIDEAYIEFSARPSFLEKLAAYPNVIVCQTFSKAHALAGARIGKAFASKEIIRLLNAVRMPYNISTLNQDAALVALDDEGCVMQRKGAMLAERIKVMSALSANPLVAHIYPTDANFILVRVADPSGVCTALQEQGILVRNQSAAIPGCIRITIGSSNENERLIDAINELAKQTSA